MKTRNWCFTDFVIENGSRWIELSSEYCIVGTERCPESGRSHLQGFISFKHACRAATVRKLLEGCHVEACRGSAASNVAYCKKEGDYVESGVPPCQGKRTDLEAIKEEICGGASELAIANKHFGRWLQYRRGFGRYRELLRRDRHHVTNVIVLYGKTGTGKTRYAVEKGAIQVEYTTSGFFLGYYGQETVLFDDWDSDPPLSRSLFLQITDRYRCIVNIKGGSTTWNPKTIYITSNYDPHEWYDGCEAVQRRLTEIKEFNALGT